MSEKIQPIYKAEPYEINTRLSVIQRLIDDINLRLTRLEQIIVLDSELRTYSDLTNLNNLIDDI